MRVANQQEQLNELRQMILQISREVNTIRIELDYIANEKYKYGKSI
jgi:uncharacterized coiled-coil protein SlyX